MTDQNPVLLVTGASAGIGAATARLAAKAGYDLGLAYHTDHDGAARTIAACEAEGVSTWRFSGDLSDPDQIALLFQGIDDRFGRIDALVNNAGIVDTATRVTGLTHARLRRIFDVNVIGAILVAKEATTRMERQGQGVIVNVSSAAARLGSANEYVDYAASKAAIDTFSKGLSDEVADRGVRVISLRPGVIETDIHAKGGEPDRANRIAARVPMKRPGTADEVAEAILWLLSDKASYITGTALDVSGGR